MALSQKLQARQSQTLTMTPQLQQAIKLLQMPNTELAEFVDAEIEKNPLLTRAGSEPADNAFSNSGGALSDTHINGDGAFSRHESRYPSEGHTSHGGYRDSDDPGLESIYPAQTGMREHLQGQIDMAGFDSQERLIALRLVDETCESGFMRADPDDLAGILGVSAQDIDRVLAVCQQFEPTGIMARDLGQCLAAQLIERDRFDPAMQVLIGNLHLLAANDLDALVELCPVDLEDLVDMIAEIRALNPRPADVLVNAASTAPVAPDVLVRSAGDGSYVIELNPATLPRVLMDRDYYVSVSARLRSAEEKDFLGRCYTDANWLVRSLDQRARTILAVAERIVRVQDEFFVRGPIALVPLTLKDVAAAIDMHESTVSRVTSNKYMATERGIFELKYFFSPAIPSLSGGQGHAAEAVRYRIASLIAREKEPDRPILSDDQLVERLRALGIDIARRTVAKYRESLKIPSSIERRKRVRAQRLIAD